MLDYQFVGIDVAKDKFDVAIEIQGKYLNASFSSDKKGLTSFLKWLKGHVFNSWVCMEATGHYSELIAEFLVVEDVKVSIVNPMQLKSFLRAKLLRNKNDIIDARGILEYAKVMPLRPFQVRSESQKELNDLNKLLNTLKTQVVQLQNQLCSTRGKRALKNSQRLIKEHKKRIAEFEKEIEEVLKEDKELTKQHQLITSVPGVGNITACQILGIIPNINIFKHAKEFAAFIGVSPKQNQSGKFEGMTTISKVGNPRLRKALYMASLSAKRYNPNLKNFVKRLEENGKTPKAILGAVMRKLAHIIFGVLKNKQQFVVNYA